MFDFHKILIKKENNIINALNAIDDGDCKTAFVVDNDDKLIGALTDGDIRRALISGCDLKDGIEKYIFNTPTYIMQNTSKSKVKSIMEKKSLLAVPIVNEDNIVTDIIRYNDFLKNDNDNIPVIIMAGGLGSRLGDLVSEVPKPMLRIAGEPILLHIINNFKKFGFDNFFISVNYKSNVIEEYFGNGDNFNCSISYIHETKRLGTGGSIKLCKEIKDTPFIVTNGDVLTNANIKNILKSHISSGNDMTIITKKHTINVEYGVLEIENNLVKKIEEKPVLNYIINTGLYCLNPNLVDYIPDDEYFDITSLLDEDIEVGCHEINDYWIDIGRVREYELAQKDFEDFVK